MHINASSLAFHLCELINQSEELTPIRLSFLNFFKPLPLKVIEKLAIKLIQPFLIISPRTDPMVALLSRLKETPKALKSKAPTEDGEHIIVSGERKQR